MNNYSVLGRLVFGLFFGIPIACFSQVAGDFQTKNITGNWSDFNAWNVFDGSIWNAAPIGQVPGAATAIFVQPGHTITVDNAAAACSDLNVDAAITSKIDFSAATSILNVKGNMSLFSTGHNCFGAWAAGAKIVFSGNGAQSFFNLSVNSVFINIEVNKSAGSLSTSSNFRFGSFTLTAGNFIVGTGNEIQGNSAVSTIDINGGMWTQIMSTTKINNSGIQTSPIGALHINSGIMNLATSNVAGGFRFSTISISNGGILSLNNFTGTITIGASINVDATSTFNTALLITPLPPVVVFDGLVNYNDAGPQTVSASIYSYLKLSGTGAKTLEAGITTIPANGTLEMSGNVASPTLIAIGTLNVSSAGTTLVYSSAGNQVATTEEWNDNFQNLTVNSGGSVSMAGLTKTIDGILALNAGTLDIGSAGTLSLTGQLISTSGFLDGTATSDLDISGLVASPVLLPVSGNISLRDVTISGNRTLVMDGIHNINLSGIFTVAATAAYDNGGESQITGGGTINISGRFITRDTQGFFASGAAVPGIIPMLSPGCIIEYGLMGDQAVQGSTVPYQNITFSGNGIKTLSSLCIPSGTVSITGAAIVDASNHNLGDGTAGMTNLQMDGGELILGTTGTQPMMNGIYNLSGGLIQFTNTGATTQRIRSPETYYAVEVTGNNVGNSLGNINLAPGGSFTIKTGGKFTINSNQLAGFTGGQFIMVETGGEFECGNLDGFSGGDGTAGNSTSIKSDIETISLAAGSIVNYSRVGIQNITNQITYQNLTFSGTGIKTAPVGILTVEGDLVKSGVGSFFHNGGTVLLNGTAMQSFAGLTYNNLIVTNNIKATSGNSTIIDSMKVSIGTILSISPTDTITLHSDATKTARMAQVDGTINYNTTGKFVVERYISPKKAWRFLSVPTNSSQTIKDAWQEGALNFSADPSPGFGTQITSNSSSWLTDGFDVFSNGGPSMKTYNTMTNDYTGIPTTRSAFAPMLGGYMTFIRGDRTASTISSPVTSTVLRTAGQLFAGPQGMINVISGGIISYNNPYASSIDLRRISRSTNVFYYVWDPKRTGYGAFQTFSWNGLDYDVIPGNSGSYGATNNFIESGQAFFVSTLGTDTSMALTENATSASTSVNSPFFTLSNNSRQLQVNLYGTAPDGNLYLADGILENFGDYDNGIDGLDARKSFNLSENLSIKTGGKFLVIERKKQVTQHDTIFLELSGMRFQSYQFQFDARNLDKGVEAFLSDNFLHKQTPINIPGNTVINCTVENLEGSYAPDRFKILLGPGVVLPVTFTSVKAYKQGKSVNIEWKIDNQKDIKKYEVEKSPGGNQFANVFITNVSTRERDQALYSFTDNEPFEGNNYYRIKSVDINEKISYSKVVKVFMTGFSEGIHVFPNPITDGYIHLRNLTQTGIYRIRLLNNLGQVFQPTQKIITDNSGEAVLRFIEKVDRGLFKLEITKPNGALEVVDVLYSGE